MILEQYAPWPWELADLVSRVKYRPGWTFRLENIVRDPADSHGAPAGGLTLIIFADVHDTYHPELRRPVKHYFIVPAATYDRESWRRWLLERVLEVERHEACEWFVIDGERPYAPNHGPGRDPYTIHQYATDSERRTSFRGEVNPE